jgi:putative Ca2+/H+ antiporter (TMEM165/GDT1 family)
VIIVRIIGVWFLLAAVIALIIDATKSLAIGQFVYTSLGQQWFELHGASLETAKKAVETHLAPFVWDPLIAAFLQWPSWALFLLLGISALWLGRKRKSTRLFTNF